MTKRELLENYREIVIDIEGMDKRIAFLSRYIGGPRPVRSPQLTGMPRGTNDPEAAMLQMFRCPRRRSRAQGIRLWSFLSRSREWTLRRWTA